jgi:hypothetical protein
MASQRRFEAHPQSAPGDFYVVNGECASCGAPHVVAPDLIGWVDAELSHCIWKKQPETTKELERAFAVFAASDLGCHRYAGTDTSVIERIGAQYCDHAPPLVPAVHTPSEFGVTLLDHAGPFHRFVQMCSRISRCLFRM